METSTKITTGALGILTIISIVMLAGLIGQENVYVCEERGLAMICDSLSKVNAEGIQTRCYFNETYKVCNGGWVKFEEVKVITITDNKDFICGEGNFIRECISADGRVILRVKSE